MAVSFNSKVSATGTAHPHILGTFGRILRTHQAASQTIRHIAGSASPVEDQSERQECPCDSVSAAAQEALQRPVAVTAQVVTTNTALSVPPSHLRIQTGAKCIWIVIGWVLCSPRRTWRHIVEVVARAPRARNHVRSSAVKDDQLTMTKWSNSTGSCSWIANEPAANSDSANQS